MSIEDSLTDWTLERKLDFLTAWETMSTRLDGVVIVTKVLASLPDDERHGWLRGKRERLTCLRMRAVDEQQRSRSAAYEWRRALPVAGELQKRELVDIDAGYRDCRSGRRVKTIVREIGRLPFDNEDDPGAVMVDIYETCCAWPLSAVKEYVRAILQTLDDQRGSP